MPSQPFSYVLELLASFGSGAAIAGTVVFYLCKSYIPSYLSKKAENLATREDIAAITREVESIKNQYSIAVEDIKANHQLRMAALSERLKAQQEAFSHWRQLNRAVHDRDDSKLMEQVLKCEAWWNNNCLYLNAESREAFQESYWSAKYFFNATRAQMQPAQAIEVSKRLARAGDVIVESVALPSLGQRETQYVTTAAGAA